MMYQLTHSVVGQTTPHQIVSLTGLKPRHFYSLRISASDQSGIQSVSDPVHFRTKAPVIRAHNPAILQPSDSATKPADVLDSPLTISPISFNDNASSLAQASQDNARAGGATKSQWKRSDTLPQSNSLPESVTRSDVEQNGGQALEQLADRLGPLQKENDEIKKQVHEEEREFEKSKTEISERCADVRATLKRKDGDFREQKRRIADLERDDAFVSQKKGAKQRILQQREEKREKMKRDIIRWTGFIEEVKGQEDRMSIQISARENTTQRHLKEIKTKCDDFALQTKLLEEQIRQVGTAMEDLKDSKRKLGNEYPQLNVQATGIPGMTETQQQWETRVKELQSRYWHTFNELQQSSALHYQLQQNLQQLELRSSGHGLIQNPISPLNENIEGTHHLRRRRTGVSRHDCTSDVNAAFPKPVATTLKNNTSNISPTFPLSPIINPPKSHESHISRNSRLYPSDLSHTILDMDKISTNAPMSPTAGDLIPAGLFGDEFGDDDKIMGSRGAPYDQPATLVGLGAQIPGLGALSAQAVTLANLNSPSTIASNSPKWFSSPHGSSDDLPPMGSPSSLLEAEKAASTTASGSKSNSRPGATVGSARTRFGSIFAFTRQRGKTLPIDGPPLGSLKGTHSQSLPRSDVVGTDDVEFGRRRGSYSSHIMDQFSNRLNWNSLMGSKEAETMDQGGTRESILKKRSLGVFGTKVDPWMTGQADGDVSSSRPLSVISADNFILPRPSAENKQRFGWPANIRSHRQESLDMDWTSNTARPWSHQPSRSSSGSAGYVSFLEGDSINTLPTGKSIAQAPIGTRPEESSRALKLNPTAPQFRSLFSWEQDGPMSKGSQDVQGELHVSSDHNTIISSGMSNETLQPTTYTDDLPYDATDAPSHGSSMTSPDLEHAQVEGSALALTNADPGLLKASKETFMQKLSRKSSFGFSAFKVKDGNAMAPKSPTLKQEGGASTNSNAQGEEDDIYEQRKAEGDIQLSSSSSLVKNNAMKWNTFKRKTKKGDEAHSIGESLESESGCEDT